MFSVEVERYSLESFSSSEYCAFLLETHSLNAKKL